MAAVRELGGRFLELDERTNIYRDIGDKKATEKTSQALREGQTKIRKQLYKDEEKAGSSGFDTSLMGGPGVPMPSQREISAEGYFGYSVQVLESLYNSEEMGDGSDTPPPTSVAAVMAQQPPQAIAPQAVPSANFGASNAAMAMAMDQFPGAVAPTAQMPSLPPPSTEEAGAAAAALDARASLGIGRFTHSSIRFTETGRPSIGRLTSMSMGSIFSVNSLRNLLESARATDFNNAADDGLATVLTKEICELVRASEREIIEVEKMMDDGSSSRGSHEDKEVDIPGGDAMMEDRISELRMTDVARDAPKNTGGESSKINENERDSLMDESVLTFGSEDMKTVARGTKSSPDKGAEPADAELLLRFSDGKSKAEQAAV